MRLVVDTNILFSFFWKNSFTRNMIISPDFDLCSPSFAADELRRYSMIIMERAGLNKKDFSKKLKELRKYVKFFDAKAYYSFIKKAEKISPDKDDAHFFALAIKLKIPLWSNDAELKRQSEVYVLSTKDIVELMF